MRNAKIIELLNETGVPEDFILGDIQSDGANDMAGDYVPTKPKSVATKEYVDSHSPTTPGYITETGKGNYTPDLKVGNYFNYVLDQNATIELPALLSLQPGLTGHIALEQNNDGDYIATFASEYILPLGGFDMNTNAKSQSVFSYIVLSSKKVVLAYVAHYVNHIQPS